MKQDFVFVLALHPVVVWNILFFKTFFFPQNRDTQELQTLLCVVLSLSLILFSLCVLEKIFHLQV